VGDLAPWLGGKERRGGTSALVMVSNARASMPTGILVEIMGGNWLVVSTSCGTHTGKWTFLV